MCNYFVEFFNLNRENNPSQLIVWNRCIKIKNICNEFVERVLIAFGFSINLTGCRISLILFSNGDCQGGRNICFNFYEFVRTS